jgi:hypothetical protein
MMSRLTPADVAERLKCSRKQAWAVMRAAGGYRLGQSMRIREEDLEVWERL